MKRHRKSFDWTALSPTYSCISLPLWLSFLVFFFFSKILYLVVVNLIPQIRINERRVDHDKWYQRRSILALKTRKLYEIMVDLDLKV